MKKQYLFGAILLVVFSSIAQAATFSDKDIQTTSMLEDFTHSVFTEYVTTTWCPACPPASSTLYAIYNSSDYPFYYVSLVTDVNELAKERVNKYRSYYIPSVYFDGGYDNYVGSPQTAATYTSIIEECGGRTVKDVDVTTDVTWDGDAKMTIDISVTNNGNWFYLGFLRTYVTEIESRWNDNDGNPYHFGFLDFALNRIIFIFPGKTFSTSVTFDGAADHGGQTFGDITQDNIMVISSVFHWWPHLNKNNDDVGLQYLGFYVDDTVGAVPT